MADDAVTIELDSEDAELQVSRNARHLQPQALASGARRAINRAARTAQTHMGRGIRDTLALRARDVRDGISIKRATDTNLEAELRVEREPKPLKDYGATQRKKGVSVRVRKDTGRTILRGSFKVETLGGHVFLRGDDGEQDVGRLPISKRFGPSIGAYAQEAWERRAEPEASRVLGSRLEHEINRQVDRANR